MRILAWCLVAVALATAAAQARTSQTPSRASSTVVSTARIRGQVLADDTGAPVRGAKVNLSSPGTGGWTATTDRDGRFEIVRIPAGRFVLTVTKAGYISTPFGQTPASQGGKNIELKDGEMFDHADVRLPRGAVIAGRVLDDNAEPVVDAFVVALQLDYFGGSRRLRSRQQAQTDDLGEFRLYGLPPGKYYVSAGTRSAQIAAVDTGSTDSPRQFVAGGEGIAPTFYPGTARSSDAQAIVVEAGGTAPPITIALQSVQLARINGTILTSAGQPAKDVIAILNPASADDLPMAFNLAEADANGHFTLPNIPPGSYRVDVLAKSILENVAKSGSSSSFGRPQDNAGDEFASVPVSISGENIDGLVVTTTSGFRLSGRVLVEGEAVGADALAAMKVSVKPVIPGASSLFLSAWSAVAADASFVVRGLAGPRLVRVTGLPTGWALKSVRVAGADVTDVEFDFNRDVTDAEIVVTARPTQVSGVVTDEHGAILKDCTVAIFPADRRLWTLPMNRYVMSARTDANGQFKLAALPPGAYLAVAAAALPAGEWAEPAYLEKLRARAAPFSLAEAEQKVLSLVLPAR